MDAVHPAQKVIFIAGGNACRIGHAPDTPRRVILIGNQTLSAGAFLLQAAFFIILVLIGMAVADRLHKTTDAVIAVGPDAWMLPLLIYRPLIHQIPQGVVASVHLLSVTVDIERQVPFRVILELFCSSQLIPSFPHLPKAVIAVLHQVPLSVCAGFDLSCRRIGIGLPYAVCKADPRYPSPGIRIIGNGLAVSIRDP